MRREQTLADRITSSSVWRSVVRHGYPDTQRNQALIIASNVFLHIHPVKIKRYATKVTYTFCLGGLSFFMFLVLVMTGIILMFYYVPSTDLAYQNMKDLELERHLRHADAKYASLGRARHGDRRLPAHGPGLLTPARTSRRASSTGSSACCCWSRPSCSRSPATCCRGTSSPSGRSRSARTSVARPRSSARRSTSCSSATIEIGQATLIRFYTLHVIFLPLVAAFLMAVHFWRIRKDGGISGPL